MMPERFIRQTSLGVDELRGSVDHYATFFAAMKEASSVPVGFEDLRGGAKGYFHAAENRIAIKEGMDEIQNVKTLIHEMAHAKLHNMTAQKEREDGGQSKSSRENSPESGRASGRILWIRKGQKIRFVKRQRCSLQGWMHSRRSLKRGENIPADDKMNPVPEMTENKSGQENPGKNEGKRVPGKDNTAQMHEGTSVLKKLSARKGKW